MLFNLLGTSLQCSILHRSQMVRRNSDVHCMLPPVWSALLWSMHGWTRTEYDGLLLLSMHRIRLCSPFIYTVYVQDTCRARSETRNDYSTSHCMVSDSLAPTSMTRKDQYISNAKENKKTGKNHNSLVQKLDTSFLVVGNFERADTTAPKDGCVVFSLGVKKNTWASKRTHTSYGR